MSRVAILIAGTGNAAFYSQVAALAAAMRVLPWQRWRPSIHAFFGPCEPPDSDAHLWARWAPFLQDVHVFHVPARAYELKGNWAQVEAALDMAPRDTDVLLSLDADTLPVGSFEPVLDMVAARQLIAGVMAHYPPPMWISPRESWLEAAGRILGTPLEFDHAYSLVESTAPPERRLSPFYINSGVMFFARAAFDRFVPLYFDTARRLSADLSLADFTGQIASALAIAKGRLATATLPMRYNFPNDSAAERSYPADAANVVIHHYLRTARFDRHKIFTTASEFGRFVRMPLEGPDETFRSAVLRLFGSRYPFEPATISPR